MVGAPGNGSHRGMPSPHPHLQNSTAWQHSKTHTSVAATGHHHERTAPGVELLRQPVPRSRRASGGGGASGSAPDGGHQDAVVPPRLASVPSPRTDGTRRGRSPHARTQGMAGRGRVLRCSPRSPVPAVRSVTDDLAPRGWRNYRRSRRASEVQRDLAATTPDDVEVTDWWVDADPESPNT